MGRRERDDTTSGSDARNTRCMADEAQVHDGRWMQVADACTTEVAEAFFPSFFGCGWPCVYCAGCDGLRRACYARADRGAPSRASTRVMTRPPPATAFFLATRYPWPSFSRRAGATLPPYYPPPRPCESPMFGVSN
jgi:hypothetical protein